MSRLTEALKRSGGGVVDPMTIGAAGAIDTFPDEPVALDAAPIVMEVEPIAPETAAQQLVLRPDATGRRVDPAEDRRIHTDGAGGRVREQHGPILDVDGPQTTFTEFNKKLIERLVVPDGAPHTMIEEYRKLAAALHHAQLAHGTKVVMVTSASPGEGKTLTASNLALTLSRSYERNVLLIDADLRKPTIHEVFGLQNAGGLLDALRESPMESDRRVPLVQVSPRLKLLLSGGITPDPMSLLTSDALRALLRDAADVFDWVIVDTPPAAFLPDCNLLAPAVDAALLVVRAFATPYPLVQRVIESVGHDKLIGVVLNHAEPAPASGYYGYGYGSYYGAIGTK